MSAPARCRRRWCLEPPSPRQPIELVHESLSRDREVDDLQHALAGEVVNDIEHSEPSAVGELIGHEVHRPTFVDSARHDHRDPRDDELLTALAPHLQPFLAVEPIRALEVHDTTLDHEHVVQRRTAIARVLLGKLFESHAQSAVVAASPWIPSRRTAEADDSTSSPLTHATALQVIHGPASLRGRYHFPETSSFSAALSSSASANSRFSLWFSCSSARSFFASATSIPPNFAF